jgi:hypothetical protein
MIPTWNMAGYLPPVWPGEDGTSPNRSPYSSTVTEIVDLFGTSSDRLAILSGLLDFREALQAAGISKGFQWLDGSFMEDVENHQGRSPNDIDVVTYFQLPAFETQLTLHRKSPHIFDRNSVKKSYRVDAFYGVLGQALAEHNVQMISYWYSMWSHNRNQAWKGFVRINLDPGEDAQARLVLQSKQVQP